MFYINNLKLIKGINNLNYFKDLIIYLNYQYSNSFKSNKFLNFVKNSF